MESTGNLDAKIEQLLNVEKHLRLAGEVFGTKKAVTEILQLCFEAQAWKTLKAYAIQPSNSTLDDKNLSEIPKFKLLLKQLVTMEVIQWTGLWDSYKNEFENEENLLGGYLGDKAAEDLRERIKHYYSRITVQRLAELFEGLGP